MVARLARGLSGDLRGSLTMVRDSLGQIIVVGSGLTLVISGPCLALLPYGLWVAYTGLALGVLVASPFLIAIPVAVVERSLRTHQAKPFSCQGPSLASRPSAVPGSYRIRLAASSPACAPVRGYRSASHTTVPDRLRSCGYRGPIRKSVPTLTRAICIR